MSLETVRFKLRFTILTDEVTELESGGRVRDGGARVGKERGAVECMRTRARHTVNLGPYFPLRQLPRACYPVYHLLVCPVLIYTTLPQDTAG